MLYDRGMHYSRLKQARAERLLTIRELSRISGVNAATISRIELNKTAPYDITKVKLSRALGMSVYDIFPIDSDD